MTLCAMCREPFAICAVTYDAGGDEICEDCDASLGPFRPSEDYVISLLRSVARGEQRRTPHVWPQVKPRERPAREQRKGPRASRFDNLGEEA